ncbi:trypsin-like peptidase domain-containing protein [Nesterenkonia sp.]|uniref:S1C family serine protease n=1 Tax=Nesterenkonia sp. TaxID=704201 RepID=UPI002617E940|nr:trypsin-like peptidase domain-containing protein [Nesterenkonia sp.]
MAHDPEETDRPENQDRPESPEQAPPHGSSPQEAPQEQPPGGESPTHRLPVNPDHTRPMPQHEQPPYTQPGYTPPNYTQPGQSAAGHHPGGEGQAPGAQPPHSHPAPSQQANSQTGQGAQPQPGPATPGWGAGQPAGQPAQPNPWTQPAEQPKKDRRGVGCGAFAVGVLLAGLLGGGAALGGHALLDDSSPELGQTGPGVEINTPEDATAITAAADKAAPSVVTLSVAGQGGAGSGSGIILDEQGHVLTNTHVVTLGGAEAEPEIQVQLSDGRVTTAEIVGTDPLSDLAVIQLAETENLTPAELGSSGDLNVGDQTIAIGAPLSLAGTVTTGIVSTLDRTIQVASAAVEPEDIEPDTDMFEDTEGEQEQPEDEEGFEFFFPDQEETPTQGSIYLNVIQTDAAINQGNSGGALVDSQGRVIGVNVAIASTGGGMMGEGTAGSIGVGFSIPIDYAQRVASELIENGEASHGLLGVQVTQASQDPQVNAQILEQFNSSNPQPVEGMGPFSAGGLVASVAPGSPAEEAGLQAGDVIEEVEGRQIEDSIDLTAVVREYAAGETVTMTVVRDGERQEIDVTLASM